MNTSTSKNLRQIVDGPSKDLLFDSFKYVCDKNKTIGVSFELEDSTRLLCEVASLQYEDGSGNSFNLIVIPLAASSCKIEPGKAKIYFHAGKRKGCLWFDKD